MVYLITIIHTLGRESIEIESDNLDSALNLARLWAIGEGFILLRCY